MSADPLGELVAIFRENLDRGTPDSEGARLRRALGAVEREINRQWMEMLPSGALMCGCGDIALTDYRCENCACSDSWNAEDALAEAKYILEKVLTAAAPVVDSRVALAEAFKAHRGDDSKAAEAMGWDLDHLAAQTSIAADWLRRHETNRATADDLRPGPPWTPRPDSKPENA